MTTRIAKIKWILLIAACLIAVASYATSDHARPSSLPILSLPGASDPHKHATGVIDVSDDPFNSIFQATVNFLFGTNRNRLQFFMNEAEMVNSTVAEADVDSFFWHTVSKNWAIKGGLNTVFAPTTRNRPYVRPGIGIEGLALYSIQTDLRIYERSGSIQFDLELVRDTQIKNQFFIEIELRGIAATKTLVEDQIGDGFNELEIAIDPYYRVSNNLNVYFQYERDNFYGALAKILIAQGEPTYVNQYSFGVEYLI